MSGLDFIAPANELLGLLQRGRGQGYRRCLLVPGSEAHALLLTCITCDPRMDSQIESRKWFYASLAIETNLPLEPLAHYLRQNDPSQSLTMLAVDTLTELALRDYGNARDILCDYMEWGQCWEWPVSALLELSDVDLSARIARAVENRFPSDQSMDEQQSEATEAFFKLTPYSKRIENSRARFLANTETLSRKHLPDLSPLSIQELLNLADERNFRALSESIREKVQVEDASLLVSNVLLEKPFRAYVALVGLKRLELPELFPRLVDFWATIFERFSSGNSIKGQLLLKQGISRAILTLPPEITLPAARIWILQTTSPTRDLAEKILEIHATHEDIPVLRQELQAMLTDEEKEWGCFLIKAFWHLPETGLVAELVQIFHQFRFSMGREYAAKAIQVTSSDYFRETLALECLWDCEAGNRALGTTFVPLDSDEARRRLRELAQDPFEDEFVQSQAKRRLVT